jgi:hypothetical protein
VNTPVTVYFIEDLCRELRCSRRTIERLRAVGTFPIPEMVALDSRPRWSSDAVEQFKKRQSQLKVRRSWRRGA